MQVKPSFCVAIGKLIWFKVCGKFCARWKVAIYPLYWMQGFDIQACNLFCLCCDCLCIYNSLRLRMMFPKLLHTGWPCLYHCLCLCCHWLCFLTSSCVQDFHVMSMYVVSLSLLSLRMMVPRFQHTGRPPWAAIGWVPGAWLQVVVSRIVFLNIFWRVFF